MQLYKHILVAIDCSPVDNVIVNHVAALALQNGAKVTLLHVVHSHTVDQDRALRESAKLHLDKHYSSLCTQNVNVEVMTRTGEPDEQILKVLESNKADYDLVAMATHGHSFIGDLLFGSVSRTLKHKISIPLLLIGPPRRRKGLKQE